MWILGRLKKINFGPIIPKNPPSSWLNCGKRSLDMSRVHIMGILNVTPDSFSDGGKFLKPDKALKHAKLMFDSGASLIDIGGESTRPGAKEISYQEEIDRVAPVIELIHRELDVIISIDTSSAEVIREASRLGAGLINDIRGLRRDGALKAAASSNLPVCLMHMVGSPETMQNAPEYEDIMRELVIFFEERINTCISSGIKSENIIIDPGFGFSKTLQHNLQIFNNLEFLHTLRRPLMIGVSRKSLIGKVLDRPVDQRLIGGLALSAVAITKGVKILRVHDVSETMDVVRMISALDCYY